MVLLLVVKDSLAFLDGPPVKNPPANAGDVVSIPGPPRSPGEGNSYPLQSSCLENPVGRGAWRAAVHGVRKSWTQLSMQSFAPAVYWSQQRTKTSLFLLDSESESRV